MVDRDVRKTCADSIVHVPRNPGIHSGREFGVADVQRNCCSGIRPVARLRYGGKTYFSNKIFFL